MNKRGIDNMSHHKPINYPKGIYVRCSDEDKEIVKEDARELGLNVSAFVRMLIRLWRNKMLKGEK